MGKAAPDIVASLDGFVAGLNDEIDPLHDWVFTGKTGNIARQHLRTGLFDEISTHLTPNGSTSQFEENTKDLS